MSIDDRREQTQNRCLGSLGFPAIMAHGYRDDFVITVASVNWNAAANLSGRKSKKVFRGFFS